MRTLMFCMIVLVACFGLIGLPPATADPPKADNDTAIFDEGQTGNIDSTGLLAFGQAKETDTSDSAETNTGKVAPDNETASISALVMGTEKTGLNRLPDAMLAPEGSGEKGQLQRSGYLY